MVSATHGADQYLFVLRPNPPPSWTEIKIFFAGIAGVSLVVASAFAMLGFWPILPFAGLELIGLAAALYVTARRADYREVIEVDGERVKVGRGRRLPEQQWECPRAWATVSLSRPRSPLRSSRLLIRCYGKEIEIGPFLVEEERLALARDLRAAVRD